MQMANKYVNRYSISYVIWELEIKTMRYRHTPCTRARSRTLTTSNAGEDVEQQERSFTDGAGCKPVQALCRTAW